VGFRHVCTQGSVWIENIKYFQPEIFQHCQLAYQHLRKDGYFYWIDKAAFSQSPSDSIDYTVMEKLANCGRGYSIVSQLAQDNYCHLVCTQLRH